MNTSSASKVGKDRASYLTKAQANKFLRRRSQKLKHVAYAISSRTVHAAYDVLITMNCKRCLSIYDQCYDHIFPWCRRGFSSQHNSNILWNAKYKRCSALLHTSNVSHFTKHVEKNTTPFFLPKRITSNA